MILLRPAQGGYDHALEDQESELYYLPNRNGEQREGWVWTNWRGQVVESRAEDIWDEAIRQAIRERVRRERIGCFQLNKGWFCFLEEDRGYANYRGWVGLPSDGKKAKKDKSYRSGRG